MFKKRSKLIKTRKECVNENRKKEIELKILQIDNTLQETFIAKEMEDETRAIENSIANTKYFFTHAKRKRNNVSPIGPLRGKDDEYENDPQIMSEMLRTQFKEVFTTPKADWKVDNIDLHFEKEKENNVNEQKTLHSRKRIL